MFDVKENVSHSQLHSTENFHCPLPRHKADALKRSLQVYRESSLSSHTPLFDIEIATGISDDLITNIVCNPHKYSVDVLVGLSLSCTQSEEIVKILVKSQ